jgi:hypothetical protein
MGARLPEPLDQKEKGKEGKFFQALSMKFLITGPRGKKGPRMQMTHATPHQLGL